jgi:hypothetical protein
MKTYKSYYKVKYRLLTFFLLCLVSCTDHKDFWTELPVSDKARRLEGLWQSDGYGYVLEIRDGIAQVYDVTSTTCLKKSFFFDTPGFNVEGWNVSMTSSGTRMSYRGEGVATRFDFVRLSSLPEICSGQLILPTDDALTNFDVLWNTFQEHYAFFSQRKVDWKALRAQYRPQVTKDNLEKIFHQMLANLNEDHVSLASDGDDFVSRYDAGVKHTFGRFYPEFPNPADQQAFKAYLTTQLPVLVGNIVEGYLGGEVSIGLDGQLGWGKLDDQTGYIFIGAMTGYSLDSLRKELDNMANDLWVCERLIIDLRFNLGGNDPIILELAGRFLDRPSVAWRLAARNGEYLTNEQQILMKPTGPQQFHKPVVLLTSVMTSSAAEIFTLMMKQRGNVKVVGEPTNGIYSTTLTKELPNGWIFTLSNEIVRDANGTNYEVTGIQPDITADFPSKAQRDKGIDPALDRYKTWF